MLSVANVSESKCRLLDGLTKELQAIDGVAAVALGGSYAQGEARADSDLDIGLYYRSAHPFAIEDVRTVAADVAIRPPTVTDYYTWGPWVNGGAWIETAQGRVDFLYRELEKVSATIDDAHAGIVHHHFNQQPPYGFHSVIYLAEINVCLPLYDPAQEISALKARVTPYPPALKQGIVAGSLWNAQFTLEHARAFAEQGNVYNTTGCMTRVASNLTQVLFALNEEYLIGDKRAMQTIAAFALRPQDYVARLSTLLAHAGTEQQSLSGSIANLTTLWQEVVDLAGDLYRPLYNRDDMS